MKIKKLNEASYGGAYDIADDQLFTRDELNEFGEGVADAVSTNSQSKANYVSAYIENGELEITLEMQDYEETVTIKLDLRKFRNHFNLYKAYGPKVVDMFIEKFKSDGIDFDIPLSDQDYPYDESLKEAVDTDLYCIDCDSVTPHKLISDKPNTNGELMYRCKYCGTETYEKPDNESLEEAVEKKIVDIDNTQLMKTITDETSKFITDTLMYDQDFVDDYVFVDVNDYDDDRVKIEIRTELEFDQLSRLGDYLNSFVKDIDPEAYFEHETSTILVCYLRKDQTDDVVDEEAVAEWTAIFNNCKSRNEVIDNYESLKDKVDDGTITFGTLDKLFDIIVEKIEEFPEEEVNEGLFSPNILSGNNITLAPTSDATLDLGGAGALLAGYEEDKAGEELEENFYSEYIYLFPELTDEDIDFLKAYNLKYLGKNYGAYGDEENWVVTGDKDNLERYAQNYLGYELHPDYLYDADDFAGDIVNESLKESAKDVPNWFKSLCQEAKEKFGKDVYAIRDYLAENSDIDRDTIREWYIDVRNELDLPIVWDYDEWDKTECYKEDIDRVCPECGKELDKYGYCYNTECNRDTTKLQKDEAYDPADPYDVGSPYDKYDYDELDQLFSDLWHEDDLEVLDDDYADIYGGDTEESRDQIALDYLDDIDECVSAKDRQEMGIDYSDDEWEKYSK